MIWRGAVLLCAALLSACATGPIWQPDLLSALSDARGQQDLVVFFSLAGRDASDRMQGRLEDPLVTAALRRGGFAAAVCDGVERKRLYEEWVGFGEGMGIVVLDRDGKIYGARPGPQDPPEFAAFLDLCAASRQPLAAARAALAVATSGLTDKHALGCLLLQLGCRIEAEPLLLDAALGGVADARHRVARLYALDGNLSNARKWLQHAPKTPPAQVTEGYVLFKERRHAEAAKVLEAALSTGRLGDDRQRAMLYLGKALHEDRQSEKALPILVALSQEGTGSTFEAAALHTLAHIRDPAPDHDH